MFHMFLCAEVPKIDESKSFVAARAEVKAETPETVALRTIPLDKPEAIVETAATVESISIKPAAAAVSATTPKPGKMLVRVVLSSTTTPKPGRMLVRTAI